MASFTLWGVSPQCGECPHIVGTPLLELGTLLECPHNKINEINEKHRPHHIYKDTLLLLPVYSLYFLSHSSRRKVTSSLSLSLWVAEGWSNLLVVSTYCLFFIAHCPLFIAIAHDKRCLDHSTQNRTSLINILFFVTLQSTLSLWTPCTAFIFLSVAIPLLSSHIFYYSLIIAYYYVIRFFQITLFYKSVVSLFI